jgi:hypothetical protein
MITQTIKSFLIGQNLWVYMINFDKKMMYIPLKAIQFSIEFNRVLTVSLHHIRIEKHVKNQKKWYTFEYVMISSNKKLEDGTRFLWDSFEQNILQGECTRAKIFVRRVISRGNMENEMQMDGCLWISKRLMWRIYPFKTPIITLISVLESKIFNMNQSNDQIAVKTNKDRDE